MCGQDDFYTFRSNVKELERRLACVMIKAYNDCATLIGKFKLLDAIGPLLERPLLAARQKTINTGSISNCRCRVCTVARHTTASRDVPRLIGAHIRYLNIQPQHFRFEAGNRQNDLKF